MKLNHKKINTKFCGLGYIKISNWESVFLNNTLFPVIDKEFTKELMQMCFCPLFLYFPFLTKITYFTEYEN